MPTPAYMTITGATQGDISAGAMSSDSVGTLSNSAHEDKIQVQELDMGVSIPTDPQSGMPTGRRTHKGVRVVKCVDKSSPLLLQAIAKGEQLSTVRIEFYRTAATGAQEHYYTIELSEAALVKYRPFFPNALDPASENYSHMEELVLQYKSIDVTHEVAGTSGSDSWNDENAA